MSTTIWYDNTHVTFDKPDNVLGWKAQNYINPEEDVLKPPSTKPIEKNQDGLWKILSESDLQALQYDLQTISNNRGNLTTDNLILSYLPNIIKRWSEKDVTAEHLSALVAAKHPHWLDSLVNNGIKTGNTYRLLTLEEKQTLTGFTLRTNPEAWLASMSTELDTLTQETLGENRQKYVDKHPYHTYIGVRKRSSQGVRPSTLDVELYVALLNVAQNLPYRPDLVNKADHQTLLAALIAKPALWPDWKAEGSFEKQVGNMITQAVQTRNPRNPHGRITTTITELQHLSDQAAAVAYRRSGGSIQPVFFEENIQNLTEQLEQTQQTPSTTLPKNPQTTKTSPSRTM